MYYMLHNMQYMTHKDWLHYIPLLSVTSCISIQTADQTTVGNYPKDYPDDYPDSLPNGYPNFTAYLPYGTPVPIPFIQNCSWIVFLAKFCRKRQVRKYRINLFCSKNNSSLPQITNNLGIPVFLLQNYLHYCLAFALTLKGKKKIHYSTEKGKN